ncbi:hypothetical protein [Haloarchaeobius sp. TZWWS8]|uniref:hypothetical protein n=1 Tax=Haloarchaeobius sp. TZWWS8 TaxID=3446121 RepID=UPI003EB9C71B
MTEDTSSSQINRRNILKKASGAAVGSIALTGAVSANPGKSQNQGPKFLDPTTDVVNFCGCTSVCIGDLPNCNLATIVYRDGSKEQVYDQECYDRDGIVGVENEASDGYTVTYCNPNMACSGNTESDCTGENKEIGTAPQLEGGRGCGD